MIRVQNENQNFASLNNLTLLKNTQINVGEHNIKTIFQARIIQLL